MLQNILQHLGGIQGYGLISLCLFFAVFTGIVIWALQLKRSHLDAMAQLPLESDAENFTESE